MPSGLRSRLALIVLLGTFLIPLGTSSLRGLTHVLTCQQAEDVPFSLIVPERGDPVIVSSTTITRGDDRSVCGGLTFDLAVGPVPDGAAGAGDPGRIELLLPITNGSDFDWRGTVRLRLGDETIPVDIGAIRNGQTETETITVDLGAGDHQVQGSLLLGP